MVHFGQFGSKSTNHGPFRSVWVQILVLSPIKELNQALEDSSSDEELPDVYLHLYFGTYDSSENIENPRELNLQIFPTDTFHDKMNRYQMLNKSKNVCL